MSQEAASLVLLPSPLLGPAVWTPVGRLLARAGRSVTVMGPPETVRGPRDVLDAWLSRLPTDESTILVPHSNAGLYVAALAAARPVEGVVFVDAGLPANGMRTPTAPAGLRGLLAGLADADGMLPPWTAWWPADEVAGLFPDETTRAAVEAEQPRLPLAYFEDDVPSPRGWDASAAYLAFGDTYADERARAREAGWPVETLAGEHLHLLRDPDGVAAALRRLLDALGRRR